jgi:hypothetical protein
LHQEAQKGQQQTADPDPAHEAVHLELDRRLRAVAGEIAEHDVEILQQPEPVIDVGDR